jgi:hypothetical protein
MCHQEVKFEMLGFNSELSLSDIKVRWSEESMRGDSAHRASPSILVS